MYKTKITTIKEDIRDFPFELLHTSMIEARANNPSTDLNPDAAADAANSAFSDFVAAWGLEQRLNWMMPQTLAYVASKPLVWKDGVIQVKEYCKQTFSTPRDLGIYKYLTPRLRGMYIKKQYLKPAVQYCALVPLIPYAYKLYNDVPYSAWKRDELRFVLDSSLAQAVDTDIPEFTSEQLLQFRVEGLTVKSGKTAGSIKKAISSHALSKTGNDEFDELPWLTKVMLGQIWCAHPSNRTEYMILDPVNLDNVPPPLVQADILSTVDHKTSAKRKTEIQHSDVPWE